MRDDDCERKHERLCLCVEIKLKAKKKGIRVLATGLFFSNKHPESYSIWTYAQKAGSEDMRPEAAYTSSDLVLDKYAKHVISCWKKWAK